MNQQRFIGTFKHNLTDISSEYLLLALEDERVSHTLIESGEYRHSVYFAVQAMEKLVRHKIYFFVNPNMEYFQERTRTHNLDDLLDFLIEIMSDNETLQNQIREQLNRFVLVGIKFGQLHNNLRYPTFFRKYDSYSILEIENNDAELAIDILGRLKLFLEDIDLLKFE